jgi:hypothetical protein
MGWGAFSHARATPSFCLRAAGAAGVLEAWNTRWRPPPCAPAPLRRCAAPWLGHGAQPKTPKRGGVAASPHRGGAGFNVHSSGWPHPLICFLCASWVPCSSEVVALSARLDEISLPPAAQSEPFFGLFGHSGRPRGPLPPSNCAKTAGAGAFPPPAPPPAPLRGALAGPRRPARNPKKSSAFGGR